MRMIKFLKVVCVSLALALTISCSSDSDEKEDKDNNLSNSDMETSSSSSSIGGNATFDGIWKMGDDINYFLITIDGNNWMFTQGFSGDVDDFSKGTWSSDDGIFTLTVTQIRNWQHDNWQDLPSEYNSIKTNSVTYELNVNQLTLSNQVIIADGIWGSFEGEYIRILNSSSSVVNGTSCDIEDYKTVTIGEQVWMAENLNCDISGSKCFGNNCDKYGRLYDWNTAITICPDGWHLPDNTDWVKLFSYTGGNNSFGNATKLKAQLGWNNCGPSGSGSDYLCEDTFGFAALPSGSAGTGCSFNSANYGNWWSASELSASNAYHWRMADSDDMVIDYSFSKTCLYSVRCVKDNN